MSFRSLSFTLFLVSVLSCGVKPDNVDLRNVNVKGPPSDNLSNVKSSDAEQDTNPNELGKDKTDKKPPTGSPKDGPGSNTTTPTAVTSVELGLASLKNRSTERRSYNEVQYEAFVPATTESNLEAAMRESIPTYTSRTKEYKIKHWYKRTSSVCKYHVQVEDDSGRIYGAKDRGCLELNSFGFQNCENMQTSFLGLKDIRQFKSAWGVRVICQGQIKEGDQGMYSSSVGSGFKSVREIWFHKDSNHYASKVLEVRLALVDSSTRGTVAEQIEANRQSKAHLIEYQNRQPASAANKDITPPNLTASYRLTGAVKSPGVYKNQVVCKPSIFNANQLGSISIGRLSIGENIRSTSPGIYVMQGIWAPNFDPGPYRGGGGAFIHGLFNNFSGSNRNFFDTGTFNISISNNGPYLRIQVTRDNPITLLIDAVSNAGMRYAYVDQISEINCVHSQTNDEVNKMFQMLSDEF